MLLILLLAACVGGGPPEGSSQPPREGLLAIKDRRLVLNSAVPVPPDVQEDLERISGLLPTPMGRAKQRIFTSSDGRSLLAYLEFSFSSSRAADLVLWPDWRDPDAVIRVPDCSSAAYASPRHVVVRTKRREGDEVVGSSHFVIDITRPDERLAVPAGVTMLRVAENGRWAAWTRRGVVTGVIEGGALREERVHQTRIDDMSYSEGGGLLWLRGGEVLIAQGEQHGTPDADGWSDFWTVTELLDLERDTQSPITGFAVRTRAPLGPDRFLVRGRSRYHLASMDDDGRIVLEPARTGLRSGDGTKIVSPSRTMVLCGRRFFLSELYMDGSKRVVRRILASDKRPLPKVEAHAEYEGWLAWD